MSTTTRRERRTEIIDAAVRLAIREGLSQCSVRSLADEANVSLGVVHYHFASKVALLREMADELVHRHLGTMRACPRETRQAMDELARVLAVARAANPNELLLMSELVDWSWRGDGELARRYNQARLDILEDILGHCYDLKPAEGECLRTLASRLVYLVEGFIRDRTSADEEWVDALTRALMAALGQPGDGGDSAYPTLLRA